jgi:hypothetical protein
MTIPEEEAIVNQILDHVGPPEAPPPPDSVRSAQILAETRERDAASLAAPLPNDLFRRCLRSMNEMAAVARNGVKPEVIARHNEVAEEIRLLLEPPKVGFMEQTPDTEPSIMGTVIADSFTPEQKLAWLQTFIGATITSVTANADGTFQMALSNGRNIAL